MKMNSKVYIFSSLEVKPTPASAMKTKMPKVRGAFVHCLVDGTPGLQKAKKQLKSFLADEGYKVMSFDKSMNFARYCTRGKLTKEIRKAATRIEKNGGVWYGVFYCY